MGGGSFWVVFRAILGIVLGRWHFKDRLNNYHYPENPPQIEPSHKYLEERSHKNIFYRKFILIEYLSQRNITLHNLKKYI